MAARIVGELLIDLAAQEGRNVELIVLGRGVHRRLPAVWVEALVRCKLGIFGYRVGLNLRRTRRRNRTRRRRPLAHTLHWPRGVARGRRLFTILAATEADRGEALQEAHPAPFRMLGCNRVPLLEAQLVLGRQRQFVDAWHARC